METSRKAKHTLNLTGTVTRDAVRRRWIATLNGRTVEAETLPTLRRRATALARELIPELSDQPVRLEQVDQLALHAEEVRRIKTRLDAEAAQLRESQGWVIAELEKQGVGVRDIAELTGLSYQRVQQISPRKSK